MVVSFCHIRDSDIGLGPRRKRYYNCVNCLWLMSLIGYLVWKLIYRLIVQMKWEQYWFGYHF